MELDDLKTAWRELDRRLDAGQAISLHVLRELKLDRARSAMRRLSTLLVFELLSGVVAAILVGSFLADHHDAARFAIPALVLHAAAVFTIVASARQLAQLGRLDYAAPVVSIQHQLAGLRASRLRVTRWLLLLSPLLWTPLAIVAAKGLLGLDLYRTFGPAWIAANLAFGLAAIPLAIVIARRYSARFEDSPLLQHLADDIAGRSLTVARDHLGEIRQFEAET
jgi:hypothetical protein